MVYVYKTPSPKAGRSVRFASSPVKSNVRLLGPTNLKSTELVSPPTATSKRRHRARRFYPRRRPRTSRPQIDPYDDPTSLQYLSRDILDLIDDAFSNSSFRLLLRPDNEGDSRPSSLVRTDQHAPNSDQHLSHYHNNLKLDIIDMARYVCTIHMFTEDEEPIKASYSLGTIQDDVDEIIRATGNMYLMSVQNTLTMIAHALHPVPIKLEDLPSSQADDADVFLADHCYSCSNNDSTRETVNFYPDADPDPLPEVANDPDPEPMDIVEDDLDNNGDANRDIGEPNEVPSAAIQQLVRLLPPLRPPPPLRSANPLDAIHHHPFRMFQHFHHIPSRNLFFTEAMLMDTINGTIHLRDLPLCVRTSATISAFCINTLADPPELNIIRGLDKHFIHHILRHVIRDHMYIDELISGTNIPLLNVQPDKLLLLRSMKHTLNRATNMVVQHLNDQQRSQFLPRRTPRAFSDIDDAFHDDPRLSDGNTMRSRHHLRAQITIHHASPQLFQPRPWTS
ncbi:hypothetical protein MHU86_4027 [Fragilaria crotonensis]|nr:hypothetical protein MHU86_4027 [Fragilaria crotonensis]